jgi:leucyl/phenylalanyl-tRNA--protein transferase
MCPIAVIRAEFTMAFRVRSLTASDPPDAFPDPAKARAVLGYPDGLIAVGGDLNPERLLAAYHRGIFPWYNEDQPVLWWSPDPRAVIHPQRFHMSRRLAKELRGGKWSYSLNQAFEQVINGCAAGRDEHGTWITPAMQQAYLHMHTLGYAHSVESWYEGTLAGGIYGIRLGRCFFGESMYSKLTGGSKVAISGLIKIGLADGIELLDCQMPTEHLGSLGMQEMSRQDFLAWLANNVRSAMPIPDWRFAARSAAELAALRRRVA